MNKQCLLAGSGRVSKLIEIMMEVNAYGKLHEQRK